MSVVIHQRRQGEWLGGKERPPYGDVDAEPLPAQPERTRPRIADGLTVRLRSVLRSIGRAEGAFR